MTLGLLARTVQLLPWDRPWENANRLAGALPVLLACGVCGLEFSFWQEATAATGEMLDLLLLAASLWLLLEYRVRRESRWLDAAVFVWGLGMAENWLMLLALPLFVGGVIWLHGLFFLPAVASRRSGGGVTWLQWLRLFRVEFLLRLAGLGLAGFSFYALLPLVNGLAPHSPWNLGQAWIASLKQTKSVVWTALPSILADAPAADAGGGGLFFGAHAGLSDAVRATRAQHNKSRWTVSSSGLPRSARVAAAGLFVAGI